MTLSMPSRLLELELNGYHQGTQLEIARFNTFWLQQSTLRASQVMQQARSSVSVLSTVFIDRGEKRAVFAAVLIRSLHNQLSPSSRPTRASSVLSVLSTIKQEKEAKYNSRDSRFESSRSSSNLEVTVSCSSQTLVENCNPRRTFNDHQATYLGPRSDLSMHSLLLLDSMGSVLQIQSPTLEQVA